MKAVAKMLTRKPHPINCDGLIMSWREWVTSAGPLAEGSAIAMLVPSRITIAIIIA